MVIDVFVKEGAMLYRILMWVTVMLVSTPLFASEIYHDHGDVLGSQDMSIQQYSDAANANNMTAPSLLGTDWISRDFLFKPKIDTQGKKLFVFNPRNRSWAAYNEEGYLLSSGVGSGGGIFCEDVGRPCRTPEGKFKVTRKGDMMCKSSIYPKPYGGSKMPMCVFFHKGYAIHGSDFVPEHFNGSHGCIRVHTVAAVWLNQHFLDKGTSVWVLPY